VILGCCMKIENYDNDNDCDCDVHTHTHTQLNTVPTDLEEKSCNSYVDSSGPE